MDLKSALQMGRSQAKNQGTQKIYHPHLTSNVFRPSWEAVIHLLAVSKVDGAEQGVLLRGRLAMLVLIQEDGATAHLHAELLDALLVVHGQQEGLEASLGLDSEQDGEIFWEDPPWRWNMQQTYVSWYVSWDQRIRSKTIW